MQKGPWCLQTLYGINVDLAVINKIVPTMADSKDSDDYYTKWTKFQHERIEEAKANFYPLPVKEVPLHSSELAGIDMFRANADLLFPGNEDPAKTFYHGKPFSIIKEDLNRLRLAFKVPFVTGENFDIKRSGADVLVKVRTPTGYLSNVISLPTITLNMKLLEAYLDNNVLNIVFQRL
jgi:arsenite/tail-anchored protein-transporting ATPase